MFTHADQSTGAPDTDTALDTDYTQYHGVTTIPGALARAARTDKSVILLDAELNEQRMSYRDLDIRARQVATTLREHGVLPGDRVCLLSSTDLPLVVTLFGTWYAGAVPVMLPLPGRRHAMDRYVGDIGTRVAAVGARLLCVTDGFAEALADALGDSLGQVGATVVGMGVVSAEGAAPADPPPADRDALALLQFTSGTTGTSRAVTLSHRHLMSNIAGVWAKYTGGPDDVGMIWLPLNHDMGIIGSLALVSRCNDLVLMAPEHFLASPMSWLVAMSRYRVAVTTAPNFAYALAGRLMRRSTYDLDLSALRWAINGAEPIDVASLEAFTAAGEPYGMSRHVACPVYGLAEATLAVTMRLPGTPLAIHWVDGEELTLTGRVRPVEPDAPNARRLVACGYPLPGTEVVIRDEDGAALPDGVVGEIQVRGPGVMRGYWQNPEATAESIVDGWLRTGDLGYSSPDGLVICGRRKDMIILNGRNLYPEEFETETESVPGVRIGNTVAFVLPGTEHMVVVAETNKGAEHAAELATNVLTQLRRNLPVPPSEIVICPPTTIPKTTSGKRQRGLCRSLYLAGQLPVLATAGRSGAAGRSAGSPAGRPTDSPTDSSAGRTADDGR